MRIGFIGAPIATSISYNLISIASIFYGVFFVERTAWHPISSRCLTCLGTLARLSVGGIGMNVSLLHLINNILNTRAGQVASSWWAWELVGRTLHISCLISKKLIVTILVAASL